MKEAKYIYMLDRDCFAKVWQASRTPDSMFVWSWTSLMDTDDQSHALDIGSEVPTVTI